MMTTEQVARTLNVTKRTLIRWRKAKKGPAFVRVENRIGYPADGVRDYIAGRIVLAEDPAA